jgi:hypothetical protein
MQSILTNSAREISKSIARSFKENYPMVKLVKDKLQKTVLSNNIKMKKDLY